MRDREGKGEKVGIREERRKLRGQRIVTTFNAWSVEVWLR
jgi:hypothetical protein